MAKKMSALEIYKILPKTNCGDCGDATCLAFAMKLAQAKAKIEKCPHASDEVKTLLEQEARAPVAGVEFGLNDAIKLGEETVLYRHEKKFVNQTALGGAMNGSGVKSIIKWTADSSFERVGREIGLDFIAVDIDKETDISELKNAKLPIVLISGSEERANLALGELSNQKPLLLWKGQGDKGGELARNHGVPVAVGGDDVDSIREQVNKAKSAGAKDILILVTQKDKSKMLEVMTAVRRLAVRARSPDFAYPMAVDLSCENDEEAFLGACMTVCKYASLCVLPMLGNSMMVPLLTLRDNIYTDPQKPIQVEPGLYDIGSVTEKSPVLLTTNFSLTYFTVRGDIESSKVPSRLLVIDAEGMSVLTAFAAGKLTPDKIKEHIEKYEVESKVAHRNIIIMPGLVSRMSGKTEEVTGWKVIVGPQDSSGLPLMLKGLGNE